MVPKTTPLLARDDIVNELRLSLGSAEHGLGAVPNFLKVVIRDGLWRERVIRATGQRVSFSSFAEFVSAPPLEGLGASLEQLRGLCGQDTEALDWIDQATQNAPHVHTSDVANSNIRQSPTGTTRASALRRLRKDRPDLHTRVLAGDLSPHAAMIEAGFRQRTVAEPLTVHGAVRFLGKLSDEQRADVARAMGWAPT